ncbi:rhodopsin [Denticeps clupeoides]|uniref:rhodopsin n=1 Tax=Denticeps clupeoides TaxID=299321 RepID=UPI0010A4DE8B|nr:rhodopsin-like [Denticeps clupeoides]
MDAVDWIESFIRAIMCITGIVGNNWLGFQSLPRAKTSIRTNDFLFVNLAVSNLITNYMVDLPDTIADFADEWLMGKSYCGIFHFCADLSETSSIFSTLFISIFWYQKLVGSLKRGGAPVQLDNVQLVAILLSGAWSLAILFSIPHFFFVTLEIKNGSRGHCMENFPSTASKQTYEILYLTLANAVPIAGIVFSSLQITVTLLLNQKRMKRLVTDNTGAKSVPGGQDTKESMGMQSLDATRKQAKASSSGNLIRAAKSVVAVATVFVVCWFSHLLLRISTDVKSSAVVSEVASYLAASYTSIIPYIFLHGVKKLTYSFKK